jgi:hypothetical protein
MRKTLEVTVKSVVGSKVVRINAERLNATVAKSAAAIAFGTAAHATVIDGYGTAYRVTKSGVRKIKDYDLEATWPRIKTKEDN